MNIINSLLLLLFSYTVSANEIYNRVAEANHEMYLDNSLTKCASEIAKMFFFRRQYLALIPAYESKDNRHLTGENEEYQEIVNQLIYYANRFSCVYVLYESEHNPFVKCQNFILLIRNAETLSSNLDLIPRSKFDHSGRIIIVVKKPWFSKQDVFDNMKEIFNVCWDLKMANVIAVASYGGNVSIFTHFPFVANKCDVLHIEEIDQWVDKAFVKHTNLYPQKTKEMQGCPVIVTAIDKFPHVILTQSNNTLSVSGMEGQLVRLLSELMNFTLIVTEPKDGRFWGFWNGEKWTGATGDLIYKRADIGIGAYYPSLRRVEEIDISYGYNTVYIVWTVKKVEKSLLGLKLLLPFKKYVWFFILATIIISLLTLYILRNLVKNRTVQSDNITIGFWEITLGLGVKYMPSGRFVCYVFTVWIWSSMVLRNSYQSSLVGFLTHTYYDESIQNMKDLLDNDFEFYGTQQLVDIMTNVTDNEYVKRILERLHVFNTSEEDVVEKIISGEIHGTITQLKDRVSDLNYMFRDKGMLRILPETYRSQIIALALPKYSPLIDGVNSWINRLLEVGIVDKWFDDLQAPAVILENRPLVLRIHHLIGPFFILFIGELIAMLAFIGEIVLARSSFNKKNNTKCEKN